MKPIIRWAGSKRRLIPFIRDIVPSKMERYIEPFCGSACVFFECADSNLSVLSDINEDLINAYKQIRKSPRLIYSSCTKLKNDSRTFYELRSLDPSCLNGRTRAIRFLYLNRYSFNGVYRTNRKGEYNVPRGTKTGDFPSEEVFVETARRLRCVTLKCEDFENIVRSAREGDFLYVDPPYSTRGRRSIGEYGLNSFSELDLDRLVDSLKAAHEQGVKFLLSYANNQRVKEHLKGFCQINEISVERSVAGFSRKRTRATELLARNF